MFIRPWIGIILALQSFIRLRVLQWNFSKFWSSFSSLLSISKPSSVKEFSHSKGISLQRKYLMLKILPRGMTFVLSRFTWRPVILLNWFMYFKQALSELIHLGMSKGMSFAKVCALISSCVWSLMFRHDYFLWFW